MDKYVTEYFSSLNFNLNVVYDKAYCYFFLKDFFGLMSDQCIDIAALDLSATTPALHMADTAEILRLNALLVIYSNHQKFLLEKWFTSNSLNFHLSNQSVKTKAAIFISREPHCLAELLQKFALGELDCEVVVVVSNHRDCEAIVRSYGVPFHYVNVSVATRRAAEACQQSILRDYAVDLIVLARYMQILSSEFAASWLNKIINIHHSLPPAFEGGSPYRRAFDRGVKLIGATAHYVTAELDGGPIIEQVTQRVSHRDTPAQLAIKGRDTERLALARAVQWHAQGKVMVVGNRTVVFD